MENQKKIVVIGSGPGGCQAAIELAQKNCNVTVIEKGQTGGVCLNIGCIPTKTLLDSLSLFEHFQNLQEKKKIFCGSGLKVELDNLRVLQDEVITQLRSSLEKAFSKNKVNLLKGKAKLVSNKKILVQQEDSSHEVYADEIIIAAGSRPRPVPGFNFDSDLIVSSDDIWNIPRVPKDLLIIGSGPIGIEFARIFQTLGSRVIISEIKEKICPLLDLELSDNLVRSLKKRNIVLKPNYASKFIKKENSRVTVEFISTKDNTRERSSFDQILIAVGRDPNTCGLGLEDLNIALEKGVFIKVNKYLQTNIENIWAIGDLTDFPQLAHTASFQAKAVANNISGKKTIFDGSLIPSCIFGYPEIAFVGKNEEELKKGKIDYCTGKFLFLACGKSKASGLTEGLVKALVDKKTRKILGAHIIGPEASNLVCELVVAMKNDLTVDKLVNSVHPHPTYSEAVLAALENAAHF